MTNGIDQGGYFHPCETSAGIVTGITRRDWLAGLAMQGLLSGKCYDDNNSADNFDSFLSKMAYDLADAMIAESKKTEE